MMWEQIRANKRKSVLLVMLIALLLFVLGYVIGEAAAPNGGGILGILIAFGIWMVMSLTAYFQGGKILLAVSGAKEITHDDHPQLFNVVEEMKIAAALPHMPKVYIMNDMALNAFATGRSPDNAAVAVTAGLLAKLNRDELQGVIAHEMSHIINRDVLFMSMVGVMLGTIVIISEVFMRSLWYGGMTGRSRRYRSSSKGDGQAQALMMVVAVVFAILAPILAQLIYFAISRRREYLADANAAVLTRYPEGLASALEAISGDVNVLARGNKATAPMYISNPLGRKGRKAASLMSTHPPIEERVHILRNITGNVSYQQYQSAWKKASGKQAGAMPPSALAGDTAAAIRKPAAAKKDARQQMREAGDLLRKVNQFLFLPCACGLRIKLPPEFKHDHVKCPKCQRTLRVPVAQLAALEVAAQEMGKQGGAAMPEANRPLEITRQGSGWMSFNCTCGKTCNISPSFRGQEATCGGCGKQIQIRDAVGT